MVMGTVVTSADVRDFVGLQPMGSTGGFLRSSLRGASARRSSGNEGWLWVPARWESDGRRWRTVDQTLGLKGLELELEGDQKLLPASSPISEPQSSRSRPQRR